MTRYLVTGGSGFIGSAVIRELIKRGEVVMNVDLQTYAALPGALDAVQGSARYSSVYADIADKDAMSEAFARFAPDVVINLAAESHVDRSIDNATPFVRTNIQGVAVLLAISLEYWTATGQPPDFRFLQVSTDEVFGSIDNGAFTVDSPYRPSSPYSASKAAGDHLTRAWFHTYELPSIVTNCSNNYGPFQHPEKLIPMMAVRALSDMTLPLYGDGLHSRDWLHVDDHVRGLIAAAEQGVPGSTYLFGTGVSRTNRSVTDLICDLVDDQLARPRGTARTRVDLVTDRPGHDRRYCLDSSQTQLLLDWQPDKDFMHGLTTTVQWYRENEHWWRPLHNAGATSRRGTSV